MGMGGLNRYRVLIRVRKPDEDNDQLLLRVVWALDPYDAASTAEIIAKQEEGAVLKRWVGVEEWPFDGAPAAADAQAQDGAGAGGT